MSEVLELAKEMGYKENFDGEGKKTPEEFIKHSSTIIRNQSVKMKDVLGKIDGMSGVINDMQKTFNTTIETTREQHKADLARQKSDLESKLVTAVNESDVDEVQKIRKEMSDIDKKVVAPETKTEVSGDQAYFDKWSDGKEWIKSDKKALAEFNKSLIDIRLEHGMGKGAIFEMEKMDIALKEKYPEKYGLKPKEKKPAGEVGSADGKTSVSVKTLKMSDLTPSEKAEVDKLKRLQGSNFNEKLSLSSVKNMRIAAEKRRA